MSNVTKGGITASGKSAKAAGPKLADPNALRAELSAEAKATSGVVFIGNADHLHLRPPRPLYDDKGTRIGDDPGVFIDFNGVGRTREYNLDLADDAAYVSRVREIVEARPMNGDVHRLNIRELKPDEPMPPFARWDEYSASHIKVWLGAALGGDADVNERIVREAARYEKSAGDRDEVLAMLASILASEAKVTDAFETQIAF